MLDKNDLKAIADIVEKVVDKKITAAFDDFSENIFAPAIDALTKRVDKNTSSLKEVSNEQDTIVRNLEKIDDHIIDHEKRIKKLETTLQS